ncbi:retrovirus-related Pol polyprotein from transposon TNT 1-94 [Trichonephila clavipes]|nr:retrovirus-related Pol polyprotein from transposon TNT 1-94 [Trichonephila clavipes]
MENESLDKHKVWEIVQKPAKSKLIKTKWVYSLKQNDARENMKYKARLVTAGFNQIKNIDYSESYSPVVNIESFRLLIALAAELKLNVNFFDVETAYLYGDLEETVYVLPPPGYEKLIGEDKVCKLKKSIYGLPQSGRNWYMKIKGELENFGLKQLASDNCVFIKSDNQSVLILCMYVDDLVIFCNNNKMYEDIVIHSKANGINSFRNKNKRPAESPILPATLILEKNPKVQNNSKNNKNEKTIKNPAKKKKQEQKTAVDLIIPSKNSFASLVLDDAAEPQDESPMVEDISETTGKEEDKIDEDVTVPPKIKPIMLKYKDNYNMVLKGLNRMYPNSTNKLTGKYIKIMASTTDEHREITNLLKSKGEEFYSVPALADRPLKVVIKGLPKSTATAEIKADLLEQGVPVIKVSQLTQRKSKFPLPIFLVEVRKHVE